MSSAISEQRLTKAATRPPFVHEMFCQMAKQNPQAVAIEGPRGQLSYGDLDRSSSGIAASLTSRGVQRGELVGIFSKDRQFIIACMLGILNAGGGVVPLSAALPLVLLDTAL